MLISWHLKAGHPDANFIGKESRFHPRFESRLAKLICLACHYLFTDKQYQSVIYMSTIEKGFSDAGLVLKIATKPFGGFISTEESPKIFQMTIRSERKRHEKQRKEFFEIFPGDENSHISVLDADLERNQVILAVHEPRRRFKVRVYDGRARTERVVEQFTPDYNRAFLVGKDETHLFIAQLPKVVSTVEMAHRILKPQETRDMKNAKRQGEWFFVPINDREEKSIDDWIEECKTSDVIPIDKFDPKKFAPLQKNFVIGGRPGHAHVAEEGLRTDLGTFVRGKITHPDHSKVVLHVWRKVVHNKEIVEDIGHRHLRNRIGPWFD
jgi:hypothetical protein